LQDLPKQPLQKNARVEERMPSSQASKLDSIPSNIAKKNMTVIYNSKQQQKPM
jgi:hypothetical protein